MLFSIQSVNVPKWPFTVASYVGSGLLSRLMDTAKLTLDQTRLAHVTTIVALLYMYMSDHYMHGE